MHLANLRSNIRSKLAGKLNLDVSMTHDFYGYDQNSKRRIKELNRNIKLNIVSNIYIIYIFPKT